MVDNDDQTGNGSASKEQVIISDEASVYSNSVKLQISFYDFVLVFGEKTQNSINEKVKVAMSPQHTKVLTNLLNHYIEEYENKFGVIQIPKEITDKQKAGKLND